MSDLIVVLPLSASARRNAPSSPMELPQKLCTRGGKENKDEQRVCYIMSKLVR